MSSTTTQKPRTTLMVGVVGAIAAVAALLIWFFGGSTPDTVNVSTALDAPDAESEQPAYSFVTLVRA